MLRTKFFCRLLCLVLAVMILGGCASVPTEETEETTAPTETVDPGPTAPADGDPDSITAKGSYYGKT